MLIVGLTLFFLSISAVRADDGVSAGVDPPGLQALVSQADHLLTSGKFGDAARLYTDAIAQTPGQYLLHYKRATAYFSLNRHAPALEDFDAVLALNAGFDKAHLMRGKIFAREGRWTDAKAEMKAYTAKVKGDRGAGDLLFAVSEGEVAANKAIAAQKASEWGNCITQAGAALQHAPFSAPLRQLRADCALEAGDVEQAVADLTRLTHVAPPTSAQFLALANMTYFLLPGGMQAQATLKQCLNGDPDSKPCAKAHRLVKSLEKSLTKLAGLVENKSWASVVSLVQGSEGLAATFDAALADGTAELKLPLTVPPKRVSAKRRTIYSAICEAFVESGQVRKSETWCDELLVMDAENIVGLRAKGELALVKEDWAEAVRAFEQAWEAGGRQDRELGAKLQRAQKLLKQSNAKDYYKVLGVARDADAKTIKKAYRQAAMTAHPDKGGSEAAMAGVNEAYEVLSNPDLRERFDQGDDPMDPMTQQGGHPFAQGGGHPFQMFFQNGGGPFGHHRGGPGGPGGQSYQFQWGG